jgi:hypothetical protein
MAMWYRGTRGHNYYRGYGKAFSGVEESGTTDEVRGDQWTGREHRNLSGQKG